MVRRPLHELAQISVQPIDEKGEAVDGVEPVETDDAGYFAFELKPKTVTAICTKLSLLLRAAEVQLVPAAAKPITVAPGASVVMEVPLSTAELERLRLRIPVAVNTVTVPVPNGYGTAAAYKAQAAKAAADKVDADKAAAHQAAAGKAAAHKAAADKADAEKAAADKAAADLAAATKPAADEAAADQEAADKSAAKPPTRGGTTGKKR